MTTETTINAGDFVTCSLHPNRGVGKVTLVNPDKQIAVVCWGGHGNMAQRKIAVTAFENLTVVQQ